MVEGKRDAAIVEHGSVAMPGLRPGIQRELGADLVAERIEPLPTGAGDDVSQVTRKPPSSSTTTSGAPWSRGVVVLTSRPKAMGRPSLLMIVA